jgi:hypothetical protein
MLFNQSLRRRGADPPKNESGRTGISSGVQTRRYVSSGNGFFIAAVNLSQRELVILISISEMRLGCSDSRAATMLFHRWSDWSLLDISDTGRTGQASSTSDIGRCPRYVSRRLRRRGDANTRYLHLRHTWTSACHVFSPYNAGWTIP